MLLLFECNAVIDVAGDVIMIKILFFMFAAFLVTVFVVQNSDHVMMTMVVGNPIRVRLIFLLLTFFSLGYFWSKWESLHKERRMRKELTSPRVNSH